MMAAVVILPSASQQLKDISPNLTRPTDCDSNDYAIDNS